MKILKAPHPDLSAVCAAFDFEKPQTDPHRLAWELGETMRIAAGLGLAAPQVGILLRAFVIKTGQGWLACFNPGIIDREGTDTAPEGCLSLPGLRIPVARARKIKATWQDAHGEAMNLPLVGTEARAFQHELDHLDGKVIAPKITPLQLALARKNAATQARRRQGY